MAITKQELEQENAELKAQIAAQAGTGEVEVTTPHVLRGLQNVLAGLSVAKNGMLPPNMGGKPYISAPDLTYAVKVLFGENDLVIIPKERVLNYEKEEFKGRINTYMVIEGTYQITSSRDGSTVTIVGTGDGIAAGSAVTSNIASTNALKNALLRTFLVTEQSAEDAGKNGPAEEKAASSNPALQKAAGAGAAKQAPQPVTQAAEPEAKATIRTKYIQNADSKYSREQINALMDTVKGLEEFRGDDKLFAEVLRRLDAGEVPE